MSEELILTPITGLDEDTVPALGDSMVIISGGIAYRVDPANLRKALDVVTVSDKGLMSSSDKNSLNDLVEKMLAIYNPVPVTVASAASVNIITGTTFVIITGTTAITTITGLTTGRPVYFYYPTGAGIVIMGNPVKAGDAPLRITQTAT